MKIAIGADHGGVKLKGSLVDFLKKKGFKLKDFGTFSEGRCDYPLIGYKVSKAVAERKFPRGVLICKTGIGMVIVANKVKGIRAALCESIDMVRLSRLHNDTNILVLSANIVSPSKAKKLVTTWLSTPALGGRHRKRVRQIKKIEKTG